MDWIKNRAVLTDRMCITRHTVQNYLHQIYNLPEIDQEVVNARVTAARWYWSRRDFIKHHYVVEVDDFPVIIEVKKESVENFGGRGAG